jgi:hypothetical protein
MMTPPIRKLMLTVHVTASVGWAGALAVFLAHALAGVVSSDDQIVRATSIAMGLTAWLVIMPLSIAAVASGLLQSLGTAWGLLRHYWVLFKLVLTAIATVVLLLKMGPISSLANAAAQATFSPADFTGLRTSLLVHAAGGLAILLAAAVLAIYKPVGLTRYDRRLQRQSNLAEASHRRPAEPRWVKVVGGALAALVALIGIMMIVGGHGPGAHV